MAQVRCLIVGRLRSKHEIDVLAEELSGLAGSKDAALALIDHATRDPFSFLFVRLDAKTRSDTFWLRFERRLTVKDSASKERDSDGDDGSRSVGSSSGDLQPLRKDGPTTRKATRRPKHAAGKR